MQTVLDIPQTDGPRHKSEEHFGCLLEVVPAAAYTTDAQGLITAFNQRAVEIWGRAPKLNDASDRY